MDLIELQYLFNKKNKCEGLGLIRKIPNEYIKASFFDPQYRGLLDKMKYGNEGLNREKKRALLKPMSIDVIIRFIKEIDRVLVPSGHLFLWIDKFHICSGLLYDWLDNTSLRKVDLVVWEKFNIGMGYRTRNKCEFLVILQKEPIRAKDVWKKHDIPNVWKERVNKSIHPHAKPIKLQSVLIEAISDVNDIILDAAMGSGSVLEACKITNRTFIGCDII